MAEIINHTERIMKELGANSVKLTVEEVTKMNKHMEEVRREFIIKQFESEQSASKIIFNT